MSNANALQDVGRFIADHISSVAQLELLLLLRTAADRAWTVEALGRELRVEPAWAEAQLLHLCEHGLVRRAGEGENRGLGLSAAETFQYNPRTEELGHAVTAVAQAYLLHRVSLIEMIYSKPPPSIRAFADAFKLRQSRSVKKEPDG